MFISFSFSFSLCFSFSFSFPGFFLLFSLLVDSLVELSRISFNISDGRLPDCAIFINVFSMRFSLFSSFST